MKKELEKQKVFQANKFIESKQTFTLMEKRVLTSILAQIRPDEKEKLVYEIDVKKIAEMANVDNTRMYREAKEMARSMMFKHTWEEKEEEEFFEMIMLFHRIKYEKGIFTIEINRELKEIFMELQKRGEYTAYELGEFISLTSVYAQRIYELIKQYEHSKQRERTIKIDKLRHMLGIEENQYKLYSNFRKKVLEQAEKIIKEKTNLKFKWEGITRAGRKIDSIRFYSIGEEKKLSKLQEGQLIKNYIGEEIYNEETQNYLTIESIEKMKDRSIEIKDKFSQEWYKYKNIQEVQECIGRAIANKKLI